VRIVQQGSGDPRPLLLVYHLNRSNDASLREAAPTNALIVNDTRTDQYAQLDRLGMTIDKLSSEAGVRSFTPVVLAGFSEGGLVTKRLLDMGADPDALVIADGTYGSDYVSWKKYADRAKARERAMLASYSAGTDRPWAGLRAVTGFDLKFGPALSEPTKYEQGSLVVLGYPDGDHPVQGRGVMPKMIASAFSALPGAPAPVPASKSLSVTETIVIVGLALGVAGGLWYLARRHTAANRMATSPAV
jgi:hypothetical protein